MIVLGVVCLVRHITLMECDLATFWLVASFSGTVNYSGFFVTVITVSPENLRLKPHLQRNDCSVETMLRLTSHQHV